MTRRQSWGPEQLLEKLEEIFEPTEEDMKREFSSQELEELCRRKRCHVDMPKWNAVHDYVLRFTRENRMAKRSPKARLRLLARAVNTHRKHAVYTDADIRPEIEREWRFRKRQSICLLDMWEQERQEKRKSSISNRLAQFEESDVCTVDETLDDDATVNLTTELQLATTEQPLDDEKAEDTPLNTEELMDILMHSQSVDTMPVTQNYLLTQPLVIDSQSEPINVESEVVVISSKVVTLSPLPSEPLSQGNSDYGFQKVNSFFDGINTKSLPVDSVLGSETMDLFRSQESGDCNRIAATEQFSNDFASIPPTATSTQNLDNS